MGNKHFAQPPNQPEGPRRTLIGWAPAAVVPSQPSNARLRGWQHIRRHLVGEPQLIQILESYYAGPRVSSTIAQILGVDDAQALALKTQLLKRLRVIRRDLETQISVR